MMTAPLFPQPEIEKSSLHIVKPNPFLVQTKALEAQLASVSGEELEDLPAASGLLEAVLELKTAIAQHHAEPKKRAYEAHQKACEEERADLHPVVTLEKKVKAIIAALELKRRRQQEEVEREARRAAEQAAAEIQEQIIEDAEQAGASSHEIASLCTVPIYVPIPEPACAVERPKGYSTSDQFGVEVTDLKALAQAALDGKAPIEVLQPNIKMLTVMAKALKGNLQIPGVSVTRTTLVSGRRAT